MSNPAGEVTPMKASAFSYARANSVEDALGLLAAYGERAKVLSGGQSLMPALNLRLVSPELIVDIGAIHELRGSVVKGDTLTIGALTRHIDLLRSPDIRLHAPLLCQAASHIAHPAIRNRGTIGGSLAHADRAAELPACMLALEATMVVRGPTTERRVATCDFFKGIYETALSPDELLVAVELPIRCKNAAHYFNEFTRRHGDYAMAGVAAQALIENEVFSDLRIALFAIGDRPVLAKSVANLVNKAITPSLAVDVTSAIVGELNPPDEQNASGAMRRHFARILIARCISTLLGRPDLDVRAA
jgi:carbon-monoxide dehydrogenase medium subunit